MLVKLAVLTVKSSSCNSLRTHTHIYIYIYIYMVISTLNNADKQRLIFSNSIYNKIASPLYPPKISIKKKLNA